MQYAEVEVLLGREVPYTRPERLPERPIIGPFREDLVDGRLVNGRFPRGVGRHGETLPLHARVEAPQDKVEDTVIAQFALRSTLRHREVR